MYITGIIPCGKKQSTLYVDGEFYAKVDNEILFLSGYKIGTSVDLKILDELIYKSNCKLAKDKALRLLSIRDYSELELFNKLKKDFSEEATKQTISRMKELGLLNDVRFAEKFAKNLLFVKHFSKRRAKIELSNKGIDRTISCNVLDDIDFDPVEHIKILIDKKYKFAYSDEKTKKRAIAFLQRYGYSWNEIQVAFRDYY